METDVQKPIQNFLAWIKGFVLKTISTNKNGIPDIISCVPLTKEQTDKWFETHDKLGLFVAVEVKDKGKKARPLQLAQIRKINRAGGLGFEADSIEEAKLQLSQITI